MSDIPPPNNSFIPDYLPPEQNPIDPSSGLIPHAHQPPLETTNADLARWRVFKQSLATLSPGEAVRLLEEMRTAPTCATVHFGPLGLSLQDAAVLAIRDAIEDRLVQPGAVYPDFLAVCTSTTIEALRRHSDGLYRLLRTIPMEQRPGHELWQTWFRIVVKSLEQPRAAHPRKPRLPVYEEAAAPETLWAQLYQHGPLGPSEVITSPSPQGLDPLSPQGSNACAAIAEWITAHPLGSKYLEYVFCRVATTTPKAQAQIQCSLTDPYRQAYVGWVATGRGDQGKDDQPTFWIPVAEADMLLGACKRYLTVHKSQLPETWFRTINGRSYFDRRAVVELRAWRAIPGNELCSPKTWSEKSPEGRLRAREMMRTVWDFPVEDDRFTETKPTTAR